MGRPLLDKYSDAVSLYDSGSSIGQLAIQYGLTRSAMWDALKRRGCQFRPQLRFGQENHFWRGSEADDWAQGKLEKAVLRGRIVPPENCQECGEGGRMDDGRRIIQAHHPDYNKPLEVMWLCQKCHHQWHKHNQAIPRRKKS